MAHPETNGNPERCCAGVDNGGDVGDWKKRFSSVTFSLFRILREERAGRGNAPDRYFLGSGIPDSLVPSPSPSQVWCTVRTAKRGGKLEVTARVRPMTKDCTEGRERVSSSSWNA
jgi:hypothetical protein